MARPNCDGRIWSGWSRIRRGRLLLARGFGGGPSLVLTEYGELRLDRRGALAPGCALGLLSPAVGEAAGELSFALRECRSLALCGAEALAFEGQRRLIDRAATQTGAGSPLEFGDSRARLVGDALCFGPCVVRGPQSAGQRIWLAGDALAQLGELGSQLID